MITDVEDLSLKYRARIGDDRSTPLVLMLHGRAGDRSVMWAFRSTIPEEFNIIAPEAYLPDEEGGLSWWDVKDSNSYGARELAFQKLSAFIPEAIEHHGLTPSKIIAIGFSQGAGLLSMFLSRDATRFQGVGILAGFVIKGDSPYVYGSSPPKIFIAHGIKDQAVPISKAREGKDYLSLLGFDVEFHEDPVGHKVGSLGMRALKHWIYGFREIH